jgi:hypothetical protein
MYNDFVIKDWHLIDTARDHPKERYVELQLYRVCNDNGGTESDCRTRAAALVTNKLLTLTSLVF